MFIESSYPSDSEFIVVKYQLLEPIEMVIEKKDGTQELHGFGIGEIVEVMEPRVVNLVATYEQKAFIKLANGDRIKKWPRVVKTTRVY